MTPTFQYSGEGSRGDWLPYVLFVWLIVWLFNLTLALGRRDFDSVTRLTWVIVLIFVPVFGLFLYWFIAPGSQSRPRTGPLTDVSGTPWEKEVSSR